MIIGRDNLIKREIIPHLHSKKPFILVGQRGIGKTELLKWSYEFLKTPDKVFVSCNSSFSIILKKIVKAQGEIVGKVHNDELENKIITGKKLMIFIDDIDRMTQKETVFFKALNELWTFYMAGLEPFKEHIKTTVWGKKKLIVHPIQKKYRKELGKLCISNTGSRVPLSALTIQSRGIPGRAWAIARGEATRYDEDRVEGEEINIAPILFLLIAGIMIFRYIARGLGDKDLYLMGGLLMGVAYFLRYFIRLLTKK
ncbi:MAG: hypothetical protein KAH04_05125 [Psychrilyobacter sp.]|nr:hypothetical protein [Psychrilyobacter sp.]